MKPLSLAALRRPRLPLPDQQAPLPVRPAGRQGGAAARAPPDRQGLPRRRVARASPRKPFAYEPTRSTTTLQDRERGPAHPRLRRRQAGHRGRATSELKGGQGRPRRHHPGPLPGRAGHRLPDGQEGHRRPHQAARRASWPACAPTTRSPSCGSGSPRPSSGPAATCASATSTATAQLDMLIAQNIPRVRGDAFDHISALTAVTLDGRVLWQIGPARPAQRPADQRHPLPDPRRRRRQAATTCS